MNCNDVWILWCKAKVLPGCEVVIDGSEFLYVTFFVPTDSIELALELTRTEMREKKLKLDGLSKCVRYKVNSWSNDNKEQREIIGFADKALEEKRVVYGSFISEEILEEDGRAW